MAVTNPGTPLSGATTAGAGTAADMLGLATSVTGCPRWPSMTVAVTDWALTDDTLPTTATVGLEVSLDNTSYVRVGQATIYGDGTFSCSAVTPFAHRYVNAVLDALDANISALSVTASVGSSL